MEERHKVSNRSGRVKTNGKRDDDNEDVEDDDDEDDDDDDDGIFTVKIKMKQT